MKVSNKAIEERRDLGIRIEGKRTLKMNRKMKVTRTRRK